MPCESLLVSLLSKQTPMNIHEHQWMPTNSSTGEPLLLQWQLKLGHAGAELLLQHQVHRHNIMQKAQADLWKVFWCCSCANKHP